MIKPEILAPAGSFEALRAAVWAGADAVYLGGKSFSARAGAANFSLEELDAAILFAHRANVKIYVTVNTLIKEKELEEALHLLRDIYNLGADAVILQDLGVAALATEYVPDLEIHASTQMTTTSLSGVKALRELGFSRVVLARELSAPQIKDIAKEQILPIEVFLHGALCVAYSGQCLHSSLVGGRSGNRGQCAQPCRLPSSLTQTQRQGYLLSPRDLKLVGQIPLLASLGCVSWKIEGRARSADYVAETVNVYRRALDRFLEHPGSFAVSDEEEYRLEQVFNRRFTTGFLTGRPGASFYSGDPSGKKAPLLNGQYQAFEPPLAPLDFLVQGKEDSLLVVKASSRGKSVEVSSSVPLVKASGQGISAEGIEQQLSRLGGTPFYSEHIEIDLGENLHLPVAQINHCRRQAVTALSTLLWGRESQTAQVQITHKARARAISTHNTQPTLGVSVASVSEAIAAAGEGADWLVFGHEWLETTVMKYLHNYKDVVAEVNVPVILRLPRIMHTHEEQQFLSNIGEGTEVLVSSLGGLQMAASLGCLVRGDSGLNIMNSMAAGISGLTSATVSHELNKAELKEMASNVAGDLEIVVHGRQLLMVHENCLLHGSCAGRKNRCPGTDVLTDRKNVSFPVSTDYHCRSYLLNSKTLSLIDSLHTLGQSVSRLRLEVAGEGVSKVKQAVSLYRQGLGASKADVDSLRKKVEDTWGDLTRGHWQRGVT